jgi:hypothetical protein
MWLLLGPYEPIENFRVAIVEDHGQPIELIQTTLPDDEIWLRAKTEGILCRSLSENLATVDENTRSSGAG